VPETGYPDPVLKFITWFQIRAIATHFSALIADETDKNLVTCSICNEIHYCKRYSTSVIFVDRLYTFGITGTSWTFYMKNLSN